MEFSFASVMLTIAAGFLSVLSPCVLPVLPVVVTGRQEDPWYRPLMIVGGLSLSFMMMGILSSIAGAMIAGAMIYIEKLSGVLIISFGLLLLLDINPFKKLSCFNRFALMGNGYGALEGVILGLTLGLIWIPCIGPTLSSVLTMVATKGTLSSGVFFLLLYTAGFAVPMLMAAYLSQFFRQRFTHINRYPVLLRVINGGVLIVFGVLLLYSGMMGLL